MDLKDKGHTIHISFIFFTIFQNLPFKIFTIYTKQIGPKLSDIQVCVRHTQDKPSLVPKKKPQKPAGCYKIQKELQINILYV